jgi:hypothetical protein
MVVVYFHKYCGYCCRVAHPNSFKFLGLDYLLQIQVIKLYAQLSEDYVSFMSQQRRDSGSEPGSDDAYQPG